jgi:hypothetical protein
MVWNIDITRIWKNSLSSERVDSAVDRGPYGIDSTEERSRCLSADTE